MTLVEQLDQDLKTALRAGDERRKSALRMFRAGIKNAEVAKRGPLDEGEVLRVLAKEVNERRDSVAEFRKANRNDLVEREEAELAILLAYMPQQLSREEIAATAREIIKQVGATGAPDKGKVMPVIMAQLRGKADGREINEVVTQLLAGQ